jgi:NADP-dependent 3-hydroxy acid dehydrogenase YdfG
METSLAGRKALVVGAYGGMGRAVAVGLAREGVVCALMGRNQERLTETAKTCAEVGTQAIPIVCDIAQTATIEDAVHQAIQALNGLNYLINCAGVYERSKADDGDMETWDQILDVNLRGTYHLARHALPEINKSPGGAIIKIGSYPSSYSGAAAFLATTRGLDGYADALFEDVREHGTKVCTIRPGFVNTDMAVAAASDRVNSALLIQPDDIAQTVLFVLTMPETTCPTEITLRPQRSPYLTT